MPLNDHFIYTPPQDPLTVLYEDDDLLIIDKPAGLLSVPGRLPQHQDSAYLRILDIYPQAKVTHRLDMATSGILLFAKHRDVEVAMSKLFQVRAVKKNYVALVQGALTGEGSIEVPLITDWPNRPKQKVDFDIGKPAKTLYFPMQYDAITDTSRVLLEPITGRTHQLRVHLAHIGHAILRDQLYHPAPFSSSLDRMALHASYLSFMHPITGQTLDIHCDVPF